MSAARSSSRVALAVLVFAVLYLPLEEFLLKWAPGGSLGYAVLRLGFEALLFGTLGALLAARLVRGLRLPATSIDALLALFVALCLCSLFLSDGIWLRGFVNLRVLLRYVAVFYLVVCLEPSARERRLVLGALLGATFFQGVLGLVQNAQGGASSFWLPRASVQLGSVSREFSALGGLEQGAVLGTTDHSVSFALFLWIGATLATGLFLAGGARRRLASAGLGVLVVLALGGIVFSYVRSCLFALVSALGLLLWMERRAPRVARFLPAALLIAPVALAFLALASGGHTRAAFVREKEVRVGALESLGAVFTREYLQSARSSRLWVLTEVGSEIVRSAGWLGFGPDEEYVKERLLQSGGAALHRLIAYRAFEDVYWVALLAYYGYLGLAVFALLLVRLFGLTRRALALATDPWDRAAAHTLLVVLALTIPLGFLTPVFDFRTFAFCFWLLAGLAASRVAASSPAIGARRRVLA